LRRFSLLTLAPSSGLFFFPASTICLLSPHSPCFFPSNSFPLFKHLVSFKKGGFVCSPAERPLSLFLPFDFRDSMFCSSLFFPSFKPKFLAKKVEFPPRRLKGRTVSFSSTAVPPPHGPRGAIFPASTLTFCAHPLFHSNFLPHFFSPPAPALHLPAHYVSSSVSMRILEACPMTCRFFFQPPPSVCVLFFHDAGFAASAEFFVSFGPFTCRSPHFFPNPSGCFPTFSFPTFFALTPRD